uniref:Uncharacterized protein n=1 Tax=Rhizophora mucronata TaxID=61149 RepID=A0A2P2N049_RHIMU
MPSLKIMPPTRNGTPPAFCNPPPIPPPSSTPTPQHFTASLPRLTRKKPRAFGSLITSSMSTRTLCTLSTPLAPLSSLASAMTWACLMATGPLTLTKPRVTL